MLRDFLKKNEIKILAMTEAKSLALAGVRPSSEQLRAGLPIFFGQLLTVLEQNQKPTTVNPSMAIAAANSDEAAMAMASGRPADAAVATSAGAHGAELLFLGYTLSHVVHAYGAMCQSITELATTKELAITAKEFHELNQCLDVAIAGAVTEYQNIRDHEVRTHGVEQLGFWVHELRNSLDTVKLSYQLIQEGTIGYGGSTGRLMERGLERIDELITRSLNEVKLQVAPTVLADAFMILEIVSQVIVTAEITARKKNQIIQIDVPSNLKVVADRYLLYSALSNLVQNAIKYSKIGGAIKIRGFVREANLLIEVEDECGGLPVGAADMFKPFVQNNENKSGLGLGLNIAQRAIELNGGTILVKDLPTQGCIFTITLPLP